MMRNIPLAMVIGVVVVVTRLWLGDEPLALDLGQNAFFLALRRRYSQV